MQNFYVLTQNTCIWVVMTEPWRSQTIPWGGQDRPWGGARPTLGGETAPPPTGPNGAPVRKSGFLGKYRLKIIQPYQSSNLKSYSVL